VIRSLDGAERPKKLEARKKRKVHREGCGRGGKGKLRFFSGRIRETDSNTNWRRKKYTASEHRYRGPARERVKYA